MTNFDQTSLMSTYSIAFMVSDFKYEESSSTRDKSDTQILSGFDDISSDSPLDFNSYESIEAMVGRNNRENYENTWENATFFDKNNVPTSGPYVRSYFTNDNAELLYVEQMVPSGGDRTYIYWSSCNFFFKRRGAYAGIQHKKETINGVPFEYNNICSIWDEKDTDPNLPTEVKLTYGKKGLHWSHFGGEGTGLHTSHPMPWFPNQWYATVIRRWFIPGEKVTRVAYFMYSYTDKQWTHYMSAAVPGIDIPLTGNSITGFLERYAGEALGYYGIYGQHFRLIQNGTWEKPVFYEVGAGGNPSYWKGELYQGVNVKLAAGGTFDNTQSTQKLYPKQSDAKPKPVIPPVVEFVSAVYNNVHTYVVSVEWNNLDRTPPQLSYFIQIRKENVDGPVVAEKVGVAPDKRQDTLETGALVKGKYYATVQIIDIFNQKSNLAYTEFNI